MARSASASTMKGSSGAYRRRSGPSTSRPPCVLRRRWRWRGSTSSRSNPTTSPPLRLVHLAARGWSGQLLLQLDRSRRVPATDGDVRPHHPGARRVRADCVYDALEDEKRTGNVRYREICFSPLDYLADGVSHAPPSTASSTAFARVRKNLGVTCRVVACINRMYGQGQRASS